MKRIIISFMTIGLVLGIISGGTYAIFSDTETSAGNTFTAGTLNLQVGSTDPCIEKITILGVKPTDLGNAAIWLTTNIGSINGTLDITLSAMTDYENIRSELETAAGDTTDVGGELGMLLKVAFWIDTNKDGTWSSSDYFLKSDGTRVSWVSGSTVPLEAYDILNNYNGKSWINTQTVISTADAGYFRVEYNFPNGGGGDNVAQSDSCILDITFILNQQ
jgi:predicted ribosomally synthesized peptide with SipW-like signal peptide